MALSWSGVDMTAGELVKIARQRGIDPDAVLETRCKHCGVPYQSFGGLPGVLRHMPDCYGDPSDILFRVRHSDGSVDEVKAGIREKLRGRWARIRKEIRR